MHFVLVLLSMAMAADTGDGNDIAGMTLADKLAKSDPEFLQFLKDEGSSDMLDWAADDLSDSSSDEADDDNDNGDNARQPSAKVQLIILLCFYKLIG